MYRLTARQILVMVFGSALLAAVTVLGVQQLSNRLQPFGSAAPATSTAAVADPALATDEQNNIEVYKAVSPGWFTSSRAPRLATGSGFFARERRRRRFGIDHRCAGRHPDELSRDRGRRKADRQFRWRQELSGARGGQRSRHRPGCHSFAGTTERTDDGGAAGRLRSFGSRTESPGDRQSVRT